MTLLYDTNDWTAERIRAADEAISEIAFNELGLDVYPNQIEIIGSDQMLDAYSSVGLPIMYNHWSFGKRFIQENNLYKKGMQGLAYEIVINSNPCISYLMEENSMTMQTLVIAHACVSGDTEFLSPEGWKRIDSYNGEQVAQYNKDGTVEFVIPSYIKREQKDFIHVSSVSIDQAITDDHRVIFENNKKLHEITGKELEDRQKNKTRGFNGKFITGFNLKSSTSIPLSNDEIKLHIAVKADGHIINSDGDKNHFNSKPYYIIKFNLKKERKIERLKEILNSLNIEYDIKPSYDGRVFISFKYNKIDKRYTSEWYSASYDQLELIGKEILLWDGSINNKYFSSNFKEDVDYIQFVWAATNKHAFISKEKNCFKVKYSLNNKKSISKHGKDNTIKPEPFERIMSEDGYAYCFTVLSSMFIIRRNNKISVTGNCYGHNHFFKNNYLFKQWTDAEGIIDYLIFAKKYINECEEKYGVAAVELLLDCCHSIQHYGVDKYKRPKKLSQEEERLKQKERAEYVQQQANVLWSTLPTSNNENNKEKKKSDKFPSEPQENLLYFMEKYSPDLESWEREIIRIVRKISQYFYPQMQTQVMNEGFASFVHYYCMNRLWEKDLISDGSFLEFIHSHTAVLTQREYSHKYYNGFNPYALGFDIFMDIKRICENPTEEDKEFFPDLIGKDWKEVFRDAVENYRDESFIAQFLSPALIRKWRLFEYTNNEKDKFIHISAIQNKSDYDKIRLTLSKQFSLSSKMPDIQIINSNLKTDRTLELAYRPDNGAKLTVDKERVLDYIKYLWGYNVELIEILSEKDVDKMNQKS